nr:catalase [Tessaracoccus coleopterorum]
MKAGPRGPVLLQDHHLREKITHFDHERIPERVVHARGTGPMGCSWPTAGRRRSAGPSS